MNTGSNRYFVITGGPGSGKSTLIEEMAQKGIHATEEAGRGVIRSQMAIGGNALPWDDRAAFAELMLGWEMRSYELAGGYRAPVLFDRGVPDIIGYLRLSGLPVAPHLRKAAEFCRYNSVVFIAPPWREIYVNDTERRQDFAEAERTCAIMRTVYVEYGYRLIDLPKTSVARRAEFVLSHIKKAGQNPAS